MWLQVATKKRINFHFRSRCLELDLAVVNVVVQSCTARTRFIPQPTLSKASGYGAEATAEYDEDASMRTQGLARTLFMQVDIVSSPPHFNFLRDNSSRHTVLAQDGSLRRVMQRVMLRTNGRNIHTVA